MSEKGSCNEGFLQGIKNGKGDYQGLGCRVEGSRMQVPEYFGRLFRRFPNSCDYSKPKTQHPKP